MGFFKTAAKVVSGTVKEYRKENAAEYYQPWNVPKPKHSALVKGSNERPIYVYDSTPRKGVRKGQTVSVTVFPGDAAMTSRHTGMRWSTNEGDMLILYENSPIGFANVPKDAVLQAAKAGFRLKFNAKCYGMLAGYKGVKEMKILMPSRIPIEKIVNR